MVFLSMGIGFAFVYILTGDLLESSVVLPFCIVFHSVFKPDWVKLFKIMLAIGANMPKAIFEGFEVLSLKGERIDILECEPKDRISKIISITLTPKSIVVMDDGRNLHIHRMVRK